ncbi:hypothetical protein YC2023_123222 [Brassica napus]
MKTIKASNKPKERSEQRPQRTLEAENYYHKRTTSSRISRTSFNREKPREQGSPPEQSTKKTVDNQTTQKLNAIELKLHSPLLRNPEKPVGTEQLHNTDTSHCITDKNHKSQASPHHRQILISEKTPRRTDGKTIDHSRESQTASTDKSPTKTASRPTHSKKPTRSFSQTRSLDTSQCIKDFSRDDHGSRADLDRGTSGATVPDPIRCPPIF